MGDANAITMNTTADGNQSKIKKGIIYLFALAAAVLATSFARAEDRPASATVGMTPGRILHAGASIRTSNSASVVLALDEQGSLVRVGPLIATTVAAKYNF